MAKKRRRKGTRRKASNKGLSTELTHAINAIKKAKTAIKRAK